MRAVTRAALAFGMAAVLLAVALSVRAGDLRVLLVGPSIGDPTVARVRQELTLLGLQVEVISSVPGRDLADLARARGAAAAARVEASPPEILLWVDEAHSAGLPQVSRVSESVQVGADPGLLALRAIELLRGRLLPVSPPPSPSPSPSPSPEVPASEARVLSGWSFHVGPAIAASPGGVPVMPSLRAGAAWLVASPLEIDVLVMIPLAPGGVSAQEGEMDLRVIAVGAGLGARWIEPLPRLSLRAGVGAAAAGFLFEGRAAAPWVPASGDRWSAMPFVRAGVALRVTSMFSLRADALAAFTLPPPILKIAGREVASFGLPAVFVSLSVEVHP